MLRVLDKCVYFSFLRLLLISYKNWENGYLNETELEQIFHGSWNILNITNNNNNNKLKVTILTQIEYENLLQVFIKIPQKKIWPHSCLFISIQVFLLLTFEHVCILGIIDLICTHNFPKSCHFLSSDMYTTGRFFVRTKCLIPNRFTIFWYLNCQLWTYPCNLFSDT